MTTTTEITQYESGLADEKHNQLAEAYNPFAAEIRQLLARAADISVQGEEDVKAMKDAREIRLALRSVRTTMEKKRKDMKAESMLFGKAVDGMANVLKALIVPVESRLQEQEDYVKRAKEARKQKLSEERREKLVAFEIDCQHFDLGNMADDAFAVLLSSSEAGYLAKKEAERAELQRIEEERKAREKAEAERQEAERKERERIEAENELLRKEKEAAIKKAEAERKKREAEARKIEKERADREAQERAAQLAKEKAQRDLAAAEEAAKQAALAAPDAVKLRQLDADICALSIPSVSSDEALAAIQDLRGGLNAVIERIRKAVKALNEVAE